MRIVLAQSVHPHAYSPAGHGDIVRLTWNNLSRMGDILHCPWQSLEIYVNLSPCIGDNIRNRHTLAKFDQIPYSVGRTVKWASHGRNIGDFSTGGVVYIRWCLQKRFQTETQNPDQIRTNSSKIPDQIWKFLWWKKNIWTSGKNPDRFGHKRSDPNQGLELRA